MIFPKRMEEVINYVLNKKRECKEKLKSIETHLCPQFYKSVEWQLKSRYDSRYSLFVLAGNDTTAIIKYMNCKYYVEYDYTTQRYKVDYFRL